MEVIRYFEVLVLVYVMDGRTFMPRTSIKEYLLIRKSFKYYDDPSPWSLVEVFDGMDYHFLKGFPDECYHN